MPASSAANLSANEQSILSAVNDVRASYGLRPLVADPVLVDAARSHSGTLLRIDVLAHGSFSSRLKSQGARGPLFGENLAWGTGSLAGASRIVRAWMASPGHRANLLRPGWRRIGIGTARGTFQGYRGATVVTADFAGR